MSTEPNVNLESVQLSHIDKLEYAAINSAISNNEDEKAIDLLKSLFLFESDKQITLLQESRQV